MSVRHPVIAVTGSSGAGTSGHLSLEMFTSMTGTPVQNVFYKGAAPTKIDLAAGRIQVVLDNIPGYQSELQTGAVRMLALAHADHGKRQRRIMAERGSRGPFGKATFRVAPGVKRNPHVIHPQLSGMQRLKNDRFFG